MSKNKMAMDNGTKADKRVTLMALSHQIKYKNVLINPSAKNK
ncbi:hypothetical protein SPONN_1315 [uncultured Candidatus Thioglobus sp.]|nr:hypothetical protein SPONN_1315 [uncultured Candidatus Thioglobus sp.]